MKRNKEIREMTREVEAERARLTGMGCLGILFIAILFAVLVVVII